MSSLACLPSADPWRLRSLEHDLRQANIHLLNLIDERLFQVKSFAKRLGLNGAERLENPEASSLDDDAQSTKGGDKL